MSEALISVGSQKLTTEKRAPNENSVAARHHDDERIPRRKRASLSRFSL
jgi:hypothetical protein